MYESRPRRKEGEPIESLVGEAIELTASREGVPAGAVEDGPGERTRAGRNAGSVAGSSAGDEQAGGGLLRGLRLPWDSWDRERLSGALLAAVAVAALEALVLVTILVAAL